MSQSLELSHLSHSFGFYQVLKDISFRLQEGETLGILGPSGAGKTTLLHLCAGLLEPQQARIQNTFTSSAFAFQEARLLPWKTAVDNIVLALLAKKVSKKKALSLAQTIALDFGLEENDLQKFPKDLSGGMKQRISFARALVTEPALLFLDEPFSALDIGLKKELKQFLLDTILRVNTSVLFITHDPKDAVELSDTILILDKDPGRIAKSFTIKKPKNKRNENFIHRKTGEILNNSMVREVFEL